jgi:hypothetical protein
MVGQRRYAPIRTDDLADKLHRLHDIVYCETQWVFGIIGGHFDCWQMAAPEKSVSV